MGTNECGLLGSKDHRILPFNNFIIEKTGILANGSGTSEIILQSSYKVIRMILNIILNKP